MVIGWKLLIVFAKSSNLDVWLGSEYTSREPIKAIMNFNTFLVNILDFKQHHLIFFDKFYEMKYHMV